MSEEVQDILNELTYKGWEEETKKIKEEIDSIDNMKTQLLLSASNYMKEEEIERLKKECATYMELAIKRGNIITKAIEYIESYIPNYDFDKTNLIKLLKILRGEE